MKGKDYLVFLVRRKYKDGSEIDVLKAKELGKNAKVIKETKNYVLVEVTERGKRVRKKIRKPKNTIDTVGVLDPISLASLKAHLGKLVFIPKKLEGLIRRRPPLDLDNIVKKLGKGLSITGKGVTILGKTVVEVAKKKYNEHQIFKILKEAYGKRKAKTIIKSLKTGLITKEDLEELLRKALAKLKPEW